jgi:hypothetical protein
MFRYFDLTGQRICAKLEIENDSISATAPVEMFEKAYKTPMREVDRNEYERLKKEYERSASGENA